MFDPRFTACIFISRYGSITNAAKALYISKQAVKKQLDSLEHELGIKIFLRSSKGMELTQVGKTYIEGIEKLAKGYYLLMENCIHKTINSDQKKITILQPNHPKLYFKEPIFEYNALFPDILINVRNTKDMFVLYNNSARLKTLSEGDVDIIFAPYEDKFNKANLAYLKLCDLPYYCIMKRNHKLSTKKYVTKEDLFRYPIRLNSIVDQKVYEHIIDQEVPFLPEKIIYAENMPFSVSLVASFCLNNGIFISKGDYFDTIDPLIAVPFHPPFLQENGIYYRKDAPDHVKNFVDIVNKTPWHYSIKAFSPKNTEEMAQLV